MNALISLGAVELIYNLTIDKTMEEKVVRKGIIKLLCLLLDRTSTDLLLMSIKLLIQLSVYKEHVDKMVSLIWLLSLIMFMFKKIDYNLLYYVKCDWKCQDKCIFLLLFSILIIKYLSFKFIF